MNPDRGDPQLTTGIELPENPGICLNNNSLSKEF